MCCPCARKEIKKKKWKEKNRATGEELRREKSKCLFMPNWATDEPAAISDSGLFAKEGGDERGKGRSGGTKVLQRRTRSGEGQTEEVKGVWL